MNKDKIGKEVEEKVLELAHRGIDPWPLQELKMATSRTEIRIHRYSYLFGSTRPIRNTPSIVQMNLVSSENDHWRSPAEQLKRAAALGMGTNVLGAEKLPLLTAQELEASTTLGRDYGEMCRQADGFAQVFPEHKYLIIGVSLTRLLG